MKPEFVNEGIEESVLLTIRERWEKRLREKGLLDEPPPQKPVQGRKVNSTGPDVPSSTATTGHDAASADAAASRKRPYDGAGPSQPPPKPEAPSYNVSPAYAAAAAAAAHAYNANTMYGNVAQYAAAPGVYGNVAQYAALASAPQGLAAPGTLAAATAPGGVPGYGAGPIPQRDGAADAGAGADAPSLARVADRSRDCTRAVPPVPRFAPAREAGEPCSAVSGSSGGSSRVGGRGKRRRTGGDADVALGSARARIPQGDGPADHGGYSGGYADEDEDEGGYEGDGGGYGDDDAGDDDGGGDADADVPGGDADAEAGAGDAGAGGDADEDADEDGNLSDVSYDDEEDQTLESECTNVGFALYEKVHRTKGRWRLTLRHGVFHIGGRDYLFNKASGDLQFS